MSLLQPADIATSLASFTDAQRQIIIDRAESDLAGLIGFEVHSQDFDDGFILTPDTLDLTDVGDVEDATTPATSPLGQQTVSEIVRPCIESNRIVLEQGPLEELTKILVGTNTVTEELSDFRAQPWSVRYIDPINCFRVGYKYTLTYIRGWYRTRVPDRVKRAIEIQCLIIASMNQTAGQTASKEVLRETLGDYTVQFADTSKSSSGDEGQLFRSAQDIVANLIASYRQPRAF